MTHEYQQSELSSLPDKDPPGGRSSEGCDDYENKVFRLKSIEIHQIVQQLDQLVALLNGAKVAERNMIHSTSEDIIMKLTDLSAKSNPPDDEHVLEKRMKLLSHLVLLNTHATTTQSVESERKMRLKRVNEKMKKMLIQSQSDNHQLIGALAMETCDGAESKSTNISIEAFVDEELNISTNQDGQGLFDDRDYQYSCWYAPQPDIKEVQTDPVSPVRAVFYEGELSIENPGYRSVQMVHKTDQAVQTVKEEVTSIPQAALSPHKPVFPLDRSMRTYTNEFLPLFDQAKKYKILKETWSLKFVFELSNVDKAIGSNTSRSFVPLIISVEWCSTLLFAISYKYNSHREHAFGNARRFLQLSLHCCDTSNRTFECEVDFCFKMLSRSAEHSDWAKAYSFVYRRNQKNESPSKSFVTLQQLCKHGAYIKNGKIRIQLFMRIKSLKY